MSAQRERARDAIGSAMRTSEEVLCATGRVVVIAAEDVAALKALAATNVRERSRLCAHHDNDSPVHEMFIVHSIGAYVRPHKHLDKPESFHVIEGRVDVVLYDEQGSPADVIRMGDYASGLPFFYRIADATYHTLLIRSPVLVFHEVTSGPFDRAATIFAPWSPAESEVAAVASFMTNLQSSVQADM